MSDFPFDPSIEANWNFHDEYEFWYIGFPEALKPDAKYKIDLARERGFKPWEEYKKYTSHPQQDVRGLVDALKEISNHSDFNDWTCDFEPTHSAVLARKALKSYQEGRW